VGPNVFVSIAFLISAMARSLSAIAGRRALPDHRRAANLAIVNAGTSSEPCAFWRGAVLVLTTAEPADEPHAVRDD
jgi:hypothetical protein